MVNRLKYKVALVFREGSAGEGWGNGKAAAVAYACEGATVMVVDLNPEAAEQTSQIILSENGISSYTTAYVTNSVDVQKVVSDTLKEFGQIDILHNNVGLPQMGSVTEISQENWQKAMDVNLKSVPCHEICYTSYEREKKRGNCKYFFPCCNSLYRLSLPCLLVHQKQP